MRGAVGAGRGSGELIITSSSLRGVVVPDRAADGRHAPIAPPCWGLHTHGLHMLVDWAEVTSGQGGRTGGAKRAAAAPPAAAAAAVSSARGREEEAESGVQVLALANPTWVLVLYAQVVCCVGGAVPEL